MNSENHLESDWTRRRWVKQFVLGSVVAMGVGRSWRGQLLADISPNTPPTDILPIRLARDFPDVLNGNTPSIQLQISDFPEVIMITLGGGGMYVLNSRCTHAGCTVHYWTAGDNILCPCHGSNYAIDGTVIFGAAGPGQPPLTAYDFNWDGSDLLQIVVPGLNLAINNLVLTSNTPTNKRLRLDFPGRAASTYRVLYSPDLTTPAEPVLFALEPNGPADQSTIDVGPDELPMSVWVDGAGTKGFYSVQLVVTQLIY